MRPVRAGRNRPGHRLASTRERRSLLLAPLEGNHVDPRRTPSFQRPSWRGEPPGSLGPLPPFIGQGAAHEHGREDRRRRRCARGRRGAAVVLRPRTVIKPPSRIPKLDVRELWHYRELAFTLVWRDIKVRYKQTFLGVAWALLVPVRSRRSSTRSSSGKFAKFPLGRTCPTRSSSSPALLPMQYFTSALTPSARESRLERAARDEGVLPAHAAPARGRRRAARRLRARPRRAAR